MTISEYRLLYKRVHLLVVIQELIESLCKDYNLDYNVVLEVFSPLYEAIEKYVLY